MNPQDRTAVPVAGPAQLTLRRLILYLLLFALVVITATGFSGLLQRLLSTGAVLAFTDVAGLARALAFTLVGGPLAALLWWVVWRRLDDAAERGAAAWGLYLTAVYALSLIVATTSLLGMAASFIGPQEPEWRSPLSNALAWAAVWVWHRWMWRHPVKNPVRFDNVPPVIGTVFGLLIGMFGAIAALGDLLDVAIRGFTSLIPGAEAWWQSVLRALVWAIGGIIVWWWHWIRGGGRKLETALVDVALILAGTFAAGITALGGAAVVIFVLLRTALDRGEPMGELLAPLGPAIASSAIGALVWRYHRVGVRRSKGARRAGLLVTSGIALAAAASGIGVIINAALAVAVSPLAGSGARTLLLGGISSLLVGGPAWWRAWKPRGRPHSADAIPPGRRIYLVVIFGISAVVALVALLVIGYRLFEFLLGDLSGGSLLDRIRAPLGLLVAAGLVSAYHFALWRRERDNLAMSAASGARTIDSVTLVATSDPGPLSEAITAATGARVTVWRRADAVTGPLPPGAGPAPESGLVDRVVGALAGITAKDVLLVIAPATGEAPRIEVIPLERIRPR